MQLPKPELYVLYTGDRKTHPEEITLKNKFFDGQDVALDIKIKMLYGTGEEAMDALDIPEEERSRYKELLKTQ